MAFGIVFTMGGLLSRVIFGPLAAGGPARSTAAAAATLDEQLALGNEARSADGPTVLSDSLPVNRLLSVEESPPVHGTGFMGDGERERQTWLRGDDAPASPVAAGGALSDSLIEWQNTHQLKGDCSPKSPCNVLAFGDSLTQGLTHDADGKMEVHPYTRVLQRLLDQRAPGAFRVDNQGGGSETARQMANRLGKLLDLVSEQGSRYHYTILLAGSNDLARGERSETIAERQKLLLRMLHSHKSEVLVLSVPQLNWGVPDFEDRRRPANDLLRAFCESGSKARWCSFLDLTLFFPQPGTPEAEGLEPEQVATLWDDGIHFTALGYDKLGELLFSRFWRVITTRQ